MTNRSPVSSTAGRRRFAAGLAGAAALAASPGLRAQAFPSRPVRIVVNFAVGGPLDIMARALAEPLQARIGQPVVVENLAGANGNIGAQAVAKAAPDGHTLLFTAENVLTVSPLVYARMGFDPVRELDPVSLVGSFEQMLVVPPALGARTVAELVGKAKSGPLNYASAGIGSPGHLTFLAFAQRAGIKLTHVPYKGNAPAVNDLLAGHVDAGFVVIGGVRPHLQSNRLLPMAVSGKDRSPELPSVPTLDEAGYPGFDLSYGYLILLPTGTAAPIRQYWQEQLAATLRTPVVAERFKTLDTRIINGDSAAARAWIERSAARWRTTLKGSGLSLD